MAESNKEMVVLNALMILFAIGAVAVAVWTVISDKFKAGTDDLFLVLVCLLMALLFAISPVLWAFNSGLIKLPSKRAGSASNLDDKKKVSAS
jgi:succinate dehydrogenase hydrophobic anchor subunit